MPKNATISTRIDSELKQNAEAVFHELGLNTTQAITLFFKQVELQRSLPFLIKLPNDATATALEEAKARHELAAYETADDLFVDLDI